MPRECSGTLSQAKSLHHLVNMVGMHSSYEPLEPRIIYARPSGQNFMTISHAMTGRFPPTLRPQRPSSLPYEHTRNHHKSYDTDTIGKSSLDLTQRLEKKLAEYNASNSILKRWLLEIVSWATSALCMGTVVGIYLRIDEDLMVENSFTLNIANILGKIASAALIIPTSEALGQLKWNWFHNSKAMWDFEIFDKASRGPWGAALLLYRTKGRSLAALGALLIVLLLAIDTFFQQVVEFHDRWSLEGTTGSIPKITRYEPYYKPAYLEHEEQGIMDRAMEPLIKQFFYENGTQPTPFGNGTRPEIPLSCPTSNCTWPIYDTLAVCSRCEDASSAFDISYACLDTPNDWTSSWTGSRLTEPFPNETTCGYFLNATSASPHLLSGYVVGGNNSRKESGEALLVRTMPLTDFDVKIPYHGNGTVMFKDFRYPLVDFLVASASDGPESVYQGKPPIVHECMLSWCVQTIKSSYDWGTYREEVLSEYFEPVRTDDKWPWVAYTVMEGPKLVGTWLEYLANITIKPHKFDPGHFDSYRSDVQYGCSNVTVLNILNIFDDFLPSTYTIESVDATPMLRYKNYFLGPWTQILDYNPWQAPNNITHFMQRLSTSMTNLMRSSSTKEMVVGNAFSRKSYIHISWGWLAFPFTLLLLSLVFLVSTMVKTSKDPETGVWKTSTMPALIYGLPEETRDRFTTQASWNSSNGDARKVRVKLLPKLGWRVSGQSLLRSPRLPLRNQPPPGWI